MFGNESIVDKLRSFDVYRKLPKDYLKPTFIGAVLSVISITLMILLFLNEFSAFVQIKTMSEIVVDTNIGSDKLKINIDIIMKKLPCSIVSIDSQDMMGTHTLDLHGHLLKKKLDKFGNVIGVLKEEKKGALSKPHSYDEENIPDALYEDIKKDILDNQGCHIIGSFEVLRVPGNFHISSHAHGAIIARLAAEGIYQFDISHTINHISFGDESDINYIRTNFNVGILNPLDGISKIKSDDSKVYEYYLKVVPTQYTDVQGKTYYAHQFTANSNEMNTHVMIPTVYFRYDISPVLVRIGQYKEKFFHFFVEICAIVGGIFTVLGIIDNLIHRITRVGKEE